MAKITNRTKNQLTDVALAQGWSSDQLYRAEAQEFTDAFLSGFGIFVGLHNKLNNTNLSVEDALWTSDMVEAYQAVSGIVKATTGSKTTTVAKKSQAKSTGKPKSTKRLSYEQFQVENGTSVAHAIYKEMKKQGTAFSRIEIAKALGIRLSTVCGQIFAMEEAGLVRVVGTKIDADSNRKVELLQAQ